MMRFGSCLLLLGVAVLSAQQPAAITIDYPAEGAIFPPDIIAPTFLWRDPDPSATVWRIDVDFGDGSAGIRVNSPGEKMGIGEIDPRCVSPTNEPPKLTTQQAAAHTWTPDSEIWAAIKRRSNGRAATVTIAGAVSRGHVTIQVS